MTIKTVFGATVVALSSLFGSCRQADKPSAVASTALFDNFCYVGNDVFYSENSLPDAESFYNPILPGWYSDPSICTNGEGDYFLATSTFSYFPGVPLFHSRDLVNWKQIGHILSRESQLVNLDKQHVSGGIFAPAISYNPANKTFYMVTTNVGAGNFFVKTQDPFGEWSDPIMLPEVGGIDPSFFFDEDGKAYIVNNDDAPDYKPEYDGHRTIRVQEFDVANDCTVGERKILVNKGVHPEENPIWIEGPHMYKINGKYYLMDAEGGTGDNHSEVIFSSDSPWGPFVPYKNDPILTQRQLDPNRPNPITCAGHADLIKDENGNWWSVFLACRPFADGAENLGRETFLMPVRWSEDGYPYMTEGDELVPMILKKSGTKLSAESRNGNFTIEDKFDSDKLSMEWLTLRSEAKDVYSLSEVTGKLLLRCSDKRASKYETPALVVRRIQHTRFECTSEMTFNPAVGEEAGMILFKDETHHYYISVAQTSEKRVIRLHKYGATVNSETNESEKTDDILAEEPFEGDFAKLKIMSDGPSFSFLYSTGSDEWQTLADGVDAAYLSTAVAGGFTGTTIGYYAIK